MRSKLHSPKFLRVWSGRVGLTIAASILFVAVLGPFLVPHSPDAIVGIPYSLPSWSSPFGTDLIGRDVLSRVLAGGQSLVLLAALSTTIAYLLGSAIGLVAGYSRTWLDPALMRAVDALLAFPPLLFLLVLASGLGPGRVTIIVGIVVVQIPGIARIIRAATLSVSVRGFVAAAVARGEPTRRILYREIAPNLLNVVSADIGPRFTLALLAVAGLNFFGIGIPPPHPDWGLMINENRPGLTIQPWAIAVPAVIIGFLTISINLIADAVARTAGISLDPDMDRR